jgi:SAM-dependent methyltransferase
VAGERFWDAENIWYQEAPVSRLAKALAQYDVYRSILHLPGDVAEFGTFKGTSLVRLATYRDVLESAHARVIYGFDVFGEMPDGESTEDVDVARRFGNQGECLSLAETEALMLDKGFENVELVAGDILETLPRFLDERPALRLALVNVDVLLKPVTADVIRRCAERLVPGGVLMLDDYGKAAGATEAAEEFLAASSGYELRRAPTSYQPALLVRV